MKRPLPRVFWILFAGTLVNRAGSFVAVFLSLYLTGARGLSVAAAGAIVSLWGLGSAFAGLLGGAMADRLGRRTTMAFGLVGGPIGILALGFVRAPAVIAPLVLVASFVSDLYRPAVMALIADEVPGEDRERAYGLQYWAVNLGFTIGPVVGGLMAKASYTALFVGDAATTLIAAAVILPRIPNNRPSQPAPHEPAFGVLAAFGNRLYLAFVLVTFGMALALNQVGVSLPLDMQAHGFPPSMYGEVVAVNGALIVLFQPSITAWLAGMPRDRILAASAVATAIGLAANAFAHTFLAYATSVAVWTVGEIAWAPTASAMVADLAPPDQRGRYQGAYHMVWAASSFIGPTLGTAVLGSLGPVVLWGACGVMCLLAMVGFLVLGPRLRQRRTTW